RIAGSRANPFCLRSVFPPAPFAFQPDGAAFVARRVHDELVRVVEPVVDALPALVREPEPQAETAVRERQALHVEAHGPGLLERVPGPRHEEAGRVAQLERDAQRPRRRLAGYAEP